MSGAGTSGAQPNVSARQLVVAVLLKNRGRAWDPREVAAVARRFGYALDVHTAAAVLERLFREGAVQRVGGPARAYKLVSLPKKAPGTIERLNHLRRVWREADSCGRKGAALRALEDELTELAARPVRGRDGPDESEARRARNRRYRSELETKTRQTRAFCQRTDV